MAPNPSTKLPEKYKFIGIFIVTSMIGVLLISVAVYQASLELELIHEIDNLYRFNKHHVVKQRELGVSDDERPTGSFPWARQLATDEFRLYLHSGDRVIDLINGNNDVEPSLYPAALEASRINERGGYLHVDGQTYTWSMSTLDATGDRLILVHQFQGNGFDSLIYVYSKRILVPAAFYVWLMVWVSLILSFLTNKLKSQTEAMEHMALHDPLTGLPNRNLLGDRLNKLIQNCRRHHGTFALALIDLDRFKEINDTLGHEYGDELLRQVAARIRQALRESDTAARVGGDEFVLLLNDTDRYSCRVVCQRIQAALNEPYKLIAANVSVGCSMGVALFPEHGQDKLLLTRSADSAMYIAKADGGGIQIFEGSDEQEAEVTGASVVAGEVISA
jgi:diguanylate cyclase (GGDEF)-like protein